MASTTLSVTSPSPGQTRKCPWRTNSHASDLQPRIFIYWLSFIIALLSGQYVSLSNAFSNVHSDIFRASHIEIYVARHTTSSPTSCRGHGGIHTFADFCLRVSFAIQTRHPRSIAFNSSKSACGHSEGVRPPKHCWSCPILGLVHARSRFRKPHSQFRRLKSRMG